MGTQYYLHLLKVYLKDFSSRCSESRMVRYFLCLKPLKRQKKLTVDTGVAVKRIQFLSTSHSNSYSVWEKASFLVGMGVPHTFLNSILSPQLRKIYCLSLDSSMKSLLTMSPDCPAAKIQMKKLGVVPFQFLQRSRSGELYDQQRVFSQLFFRPGFCFPH